MLDNGQQMSDDELMLVIREKLMDVVKIMNVAKMRKIKTNFSIGPYDPQKENNQDAPYALMFLSMVKEVYNVKS